MLCDAIFFGNYDDNAIAWLGIGATSVVEIFVVGEKMTASLKLLALRAQNFFTLVHSDTKGYSLSTTR